MISFFLQVSLLLRFHRRALVRASVWAAIPAALAVWGFATLQPFYLYPRLTERGEKSSIYLADGCSIAPAEYFVGWPAESHHYQAPSGGNRFPASQPVIGMFDSGLQFMGHRLCIPTRVIWSGAILDWAFFMSIALAITLLVCRLRFSDRFARGECVRCGYNLKDLSPCAKCPECGSAR